MSDLKILLGLLTFSQSLAHLSPHHLQCSPQLVCSCTLSSLSCSNSTIWSRGWLCTSGPVALSVLCSILHLRCRGRFFSSTFGKAYYLTVNIVGEWFMVVCVWHWSCFQQAAVKEERREARKAKKELRGIYRCEAQRAQKVAAISGPSAIHLM